MSKYIKISTIGPASTSPMPQLPKQQLVKGMIDFWSEKFDQVLPDQPDLIVLPETCDRYGDNFSEAAMEYFRCRGDQLLEFFQENAARHNCYIAYPALREMNDGLWRNSVRLIDRSGDVIGTYEKNHVTISETTESGILPGAEAPVFECDFGRVACAICFDLNFDELRQKYVAARPDLILFSSMYHGGLMQAYWAYSCRAYFVSSIGYSGLRSSIISPVGQTLASTTCYQDFVTATVNLDYCVAHLDYNRDRFRQLKQKYGSRVQITDPDLLGSVLISSETGERTAIEMVEEFEIELLDDYMARSLEHRHAYVSTLPVA